MILNIILSFFSINHIIFCQKQNAITAQHLLDIEVSKAFLGTYSLHACVADVYSASIVEKATMLCNLDV